MLLKRIFGQWRKRRWSRYFTTADCTVRTRRAVFGFKVWWALDLKILGQPFGPEPLHRIASLDGWHIPSLTDHQLVELPLIYGLHYDGCQIDYKVSIGHTRRVLRENCDRAAHSRRTR